MAGEIILYTTEDGIGQVGLKAVDGDVWLTQAQMATLFQTSIPNINQHIKAILADGEQPEATLKPYLIVQPEGDRMVERKVTHYNLPMIMAVGFRVRSARGIQFRQWAAAQLSEYLVKGFVMDDARLKEPGGDPYFDELLERIRDIRASEKRFYQQVRDVFAATSSDYDAKSDTASTFFKTIQNKMLYAVTGKTAAELIVDRADPAAPNMQLTSWKGSRVRKGDVTISKNYLTEAEVRELNRLTTMFLDFAQDRAERRKQTLMAEWIEQTDRFLTFNEREVLIGKGNMSHEAMETIVGKRYATFDAKRREAERLTAEQDDAAETLKVIEGVSKRIRKRKGDQI
ncbi:hydroxyacid dehydrogenase [Novosphingobium fuchskuhlense]|uniref:Hydroxyacid dehydrogenase n=1 Tax=Novosphingobium fuchskuhlense TaxID=1117702 RepID=A0A117UZ46_9SPHN|nr:virulence RhuM family protein [Novosphingobium fuchskuhlense]KUR73514.1 hydroxyacid dehydrogenase [Novosphingobium fuchskuhlense]